MSRVELHEYSLVYSPMREVLSSLCKCVLAVSTHRDSPVEHDRKLVECCAPVADRHCPPLADVFQRQIEQLKHRLIIREQRAVLTHLAQRHIQRLNGVLPVDGT